MDHKNLAFLVCTFSFWGSQLQLSFRSWGHNHYRTHLVCRQVVWPIICPNHQKCLNGKPGQAILAIVVHLLGQWKVKNHASSNSWVKTDQPKKTPSHEKHESCLEWHETKGKRERKNVQCFFHVVHIWVESVAMKNTKRKQHQHKTRWANMTFGVMVDLVLGHTYPKSQFLS